jgi:hypothetical protein
MAEKNTTKVSQIRARFRTDLSFVRLKSFEMESSAGRSKERLRRVSLTAIRSFAALPCTFIFCSTADHSSWIMPAGTEFLPSRAQRVGRQSGARVVPDEFDPARPF